MNHRVKLTRQDGEQVIHIPVGMELPGDEAVISKDGDRIVIETAPSVEKDDLLSWLATLDPLTDEDRLPEINDDDLLPLDGVRL